MDFMGSTIAAPCVLIAKMLKKCFASQRMFFPTKSNLGGKLCLVVLGLLDLQIESAVLMSATDL